MAKQMSVIFAGTAVNVVERMPKKWPSACYTASAWPQSQALKLMAAMRQRTFTANKL